MGEVGKDDCGCRSCLKWRAVATRPNPVLIMDVGVTTWILSSHSLRIKCVSQPLYLRQSILDRDWTCGDRPSPPELVSTPLSG